LCRTGEPSPSLLTTHIFVIGGEPQAGARARPPSSSAGYISFEARSRVATAWRGDEGAACSCRRRQFQQLLEIWPILVGG